jgi:hypothetical protein
VKTPHDRQFVVDCEYSQPTNQLISMAIVPLWLPNSQIEAMEVSGKEFYEVISPLPNDLTDWVKVNVIPQLNKTAIPFQYFQEKLESFLLEHRVQELHYDWCEDIAYFNRVMITGPGCRIKIYQGSSSRYLSHVHHPDIEGRSAKPHNALSDARGIAEAIRRRLYQIP